LITKKRGRHDIAELLLKVVLNTKIKSTKKKIEMIVSVSMIFLGIVLPMLGIELDFVTEKLFCSPVTEFELTPKIH
jgi:hypothetical protein